MRNYTLITFLFSFLYGTVINVPDDYPTVQEAINQASQGDSVIISNGVYFENLILNKEIFIGSQAVFDDLNTSNWYENSNVNQTIINGSTLNDPLKRSCLVIRDGDIAPVIKGLTFEGGVGTSMLVNECDLTRSEISGGAILIYDAYPTINHNRFINNGLTPPNERGRKGSKNGGAIAHYEDAEVEFDEDRGNFNNVIRNDRNRPESMNIQNNYFDGNSSGNGQEFFTHGYDGTIDMSNSVFEDIDCADNSVNNFVLSSFDNSASYVQDNITGSCIEENNYYVSSDGSDSNSGSIGEPFATIGHALTLAKNSGDAIVINVGTGTYSPSTNGEIFPIVIPDNVYLIGENSTTTVLSAEADESKESGVLIIQECTNIKLENFTLKNGYNSNSHGCAGGGGLLLTANDRENPTYSELKPNMAIIKNLIIENNHSWNGGGLSFWRVEGPSLSNVVIRNNTTDRGGGGVFIYGSDLSMDSIEVTENTTLGSLDGEGHGGGIMLYQSSGYFDHININNNESVSMGGGIWSAYGSKWTMANSVISDNLGFWNAGGIALYENNDAGQGQYEYCGDCSPVFINTHIKNNITNDPWVGWGTGGGIMSWSSNPRFESCTIEGNQATDFGGGATFWSGDPVFNNCILKNNYADGYAGGIAIEETYDGWPHGTLTMNGCVLAGNSAGIQGGAIGSLDPGLVSLINCTVVDNISTGEYSGIYASNGKIINSIIWGNLPTVSSVVSNIDVTYSNVENGFNGIGNIELNPLFYDQSNGDYRLQEGSPCIDAGTADINEDGVDEIAEYYGAAPDMGAFEFESDVVSDVGSETIIPEVFTLHQNYPNPFNPTTQIRYDLPENGFISINIYDVMGRKIKSLINMKQDAGYRSINWNAANDMGQPVSAGMYIYTIQAGGFRQTRKMVLLK